MARLGSSSDGVATRIVGREAEVRVLSEHLEAAGAGAGRMVLLEGPAGIGKSSLLAELRPLADQAGACWLAARASELERDFPFGVVRQLFEAVAATADDALLGGAAALAEAALGTPQDDPHTEPGFAVLHGLFWFVANLAERTPLVLAVDDLQWVDAPSLRFLDHLALRLEGLPVLAALTARAGEASLTVGPIARLAQYPDVHPLAVDPLAIGAVAAIVRSGLPGEDVPDELVAACHEVTGGNAFLLREVVGELRRSGQGAGADPAAVRRLAPPAIVRSLQLRLQSLPPHAVALAHAIAVLGDGADPGLAAELAGVTPREAEEAAELLARTDLLAPGRPLRFAHTVILSAVRESLPQALRSDLHRRAAAAIVHRSGPGGLDGAAGHLLAVDPIGDHVAAGVLREAAAVARRRGAADTASTYLRRALAEPPAPEDVPRLLVDLAGAAGAAGESDALVFAERALAATEDPLLRLEAAREAAVGHISAGRHEAAADMMAGVLRTGGLPLKERMAGEAVLLVSAAITAEARRTHAERLLAARELAERLGDAAPAALLAVVAFELVMVEGEHRRAGVLLDRALAGGRLLREVTADSPFPYIAGNALIVSGRYEAADGLATELMADAAARGSIRAFALATAQRGLCRLRAGRLKAAEADARAALENAEGRTVIQLAVAAATLAGVLLESGDLTGAEQLLALVPPDGRRPETHLGVVVEDLRARLYATAGRWEDTLMACEACAAWERHFEVRHGGWTAWRALAARAHAGLGDRAQAIALAREGVALARAYGVPRTLGLALRGAGVVAEDPAERVALLREAATVLTDGGVRAHAARAQLELADALRDAGDAAAARAAYGEALAAAEAIGAHPVEQAARDALVALGARPRRRTVSGLQALTAGERRVAELAAEGLSNRDIAERLFLTLKTVENHLTATYRKLGIGSRAQLADRLTHPTA